ncbi:MAG: RNA polymerase subunit sigma, partial [Parvibaculum sp.]|nr:RNA polymerase subunit sigma [Parvibaculum sp.]
MRTKHALRIGPARAGCHDWQPNLRKLGLMNKDKAPGEAPAGSPEEMARLIAAIALHADRTAFAR